MLRVSDKEFNCWTEVKTNNQILSDIISAVVAKITSLASPYVNTDNSNKQNVNHIPQSSRPHSQASAHTLLNPVYDVVQPSSLKTDPSWHARLFLNKHICAVSKRVVRLSLFHLLPVFHKVWLTDSKKKEDGIKGKQKVGCAQERFLKGQTFVQLHSSPVPTKRWHVETLKNRIQVTGPARLPLFSVSTHTSLFLSFPTVSCFKMFCPL